MSVTPSITPDQLKVIRDAVASFNSGVHMFSWISPDATKDDPLTFAQYTEGGMNIDALIELGLIEDVSYKHQEVIQKIKEQTGRTYRRLHITPLAHAFFNAYESPSIH